MFGLRKFFALFHSTTSPFDEGTGVFNTVDIEAAKETLQLKEHAYESGLKNWPKPDTTSKDATAVAIDNYLNNLIRLAKDKFDDRLRAIESLTKSEAKDPIQAITELYERAKNELRIAARGYYSELLTRRRRWILSEKEYVEFRRQHDRIGPARFPESRTMIYGLIFLFAMIELLTNAYALGDAHPNGPLGVAIEIFMFGFANIAVAYLLGFYIWRWFFHKSLMRKIAGFVLTIPMMIFLAFLNFFLAHYRDAVSNLAHSQLEVYDLLNMMQKLGRDALMNLVSNHFIMDDFRSYLLLFVGLLTAVIATKKSFDLDDPYPGYGKLERDQAKYADDLNNHQVAVLSNTNDLIEDYSNKINWQLSQMTSSQASANRAKSDRERLYQKYNNWLVSVQSVGNTLYAFYREENVKVRKEKQIPISFSEHPYELPKGVEVKPDASCKELLSEHSSYDQVRKKSKEYLEELNKLLRKYQNIFHDVEKISSDKILDISHLEEPTAFKG